MLDYHGPGHLAVKPGRKGCGAQGLFGRRAERALRIAFEHLNNVVTQRTAYDTTRLAGLQGKGGLFDLRHRQNPPWKPAQVARAGVEGIGAFNDGREPTFADSDF